MCFTLQMKKQRSALSLAVDPKIVTDGLVSPRLQQRRCSASSNISEVMQQAQFLGCFNNDCHRPRGRKWGGETRPPEGATKFVFLHATKWSPVFSIMTIFLQVWKQIENPSVTSLKCPAAGLERNSAPCCQILTQTHSTPGCSMIYFGKFELKQTWYQLDPVSLWIVIMLVRVRRDRTSQFSVRDLGCFCKLARLFSAKLNVKDGPMEAPRHQHHHFITAGGAPLHLDGMDGPFRHQLWLFHV